MRPLLILLAALPCGAFESKMIHAVGNESIFETSDRFTEFQSLRLFYRGDLKAEVSNAVSVRMLGDLDYDPLYPLLDDPVRDRERLDMELQGNLRELWMDVRHGPLAFKLGEQTVSWDYTSGTAPVTNILNPVDRRSPFAQIRPQYLPVPMVKGEWFLSDDSKGMAGVLFGGEGDRLPRYGSRYDFLGLADFSPRNDPWPSLLPTGYAVSYEREAGEDRAFAVRYAYTLDNNPILSLRPGTMAFAESHPECHLVGLSAMAGILQGEIKGDAALSIDKTFNYFRDGVLGHEEGNLLRARVLYGNNTFANTILSAGYEESRTFDAPAGALQARHESSLLFQADHQAVDWNLAVSLTGQQFLGRSDLYGRNAQVTGLTFTYLGIQNFRFTLLARKVFHAGPDRPFQSGLVGTTEFIF
jgi:hypothetical protein